MTLTSPSSCLRTVVFPNSSHISVSVSLLYMPLSHEASVDGGHAGCARTAVPSPGAAPA